VPLHCLRIILRHALAVVIHEAKHGLGFGIPLLGKRPEFMQGSDVVTGLMCLHALL
jgi:hypothetical protein|tara:strand:+ start:386 stop:553 length:168 start_codon:yes stop_codon:yes gene_type:complete